MTSAIYLRHINSKIPQHRWRFNQAEDRKQLKSIFEITRANQNATGPEAISTPQHCWRQRCRVNGRAWHQREKGGCRAGWYAAIVYAEKDSYEKLFQDY